MDDVSDGEDDDEELKEQQRMAREIREDAERTLAVIAAVTEGRRIKAEEISKIMDEDITVVNVLKDDVPSYVANHHDEEQDEEDEEEVDHNNDVYQQNGLCFAGERALKYISPFVTSPCASIDYDRLIDHHLEMVAVREGLFPDDESLFVNHEIGDRMANDCFVSRNE